MMALHLALKCLDRGRAFAISWNLRNHIADRFMHIRCARILPLYGQPLLVDFNILQGKVAPRLMNNDCNRSGDSRRRSRGCRPAEPCTVIEGRCDPEIEIDAEPTAEGNSKARQAKFHCQAIAPWAGFNRGLNFARSCQNDTSCLRSGDDSRRGWFGESRVLLTRLHDHDLWAQSFIEASSAVPIGHRS